MGKLLLLFVVVPAVELVLLIKLGGMIGILATVAIIVITGVAGASLARWQGLGVLREVQNEVARGGLPAGALVDGVIILLAAALLMTPGFLTDLVGFSCLIPGLRSVIKRAAWKRLERSVQEGRTGLFVQFGGQSMSTTPRQENDPSKNIEL